MNPVTLPEFLHDATGRGPVVGLLPTDRLTCVPDGIRTSVVDGAQATTLDDLYTQFADAWAFPEHFGRNKSAFDDCMRDLDGSGTDTTGEFPAGFLTHITNAHRLLVDDAADFDWFAESIPFYRDHYRDHFAQSEVHRASVFAVVLSTPKRHRDRVRSRWRAAGVPVVVVDRS